MDLDVARIENAVQVIDPVFLNTPQYLDEQLCSALGDRAVTVKVETANPVRSFKGRGADLMLSTLAPGTPVVCASSGNFGQAVAYAGRARGMPVVVFVPETVNPVKRGRMETFGARVIAAGADGHRRGRPRPPTPNVILTISTCRMASRRRSLRASGRSESS
ncbi:pyridoxal-phosphate dependent enzyme [Streptomyces mexicanus]|uniref:pyridoxal-phosphate dependent enzyme n=1 Tax=Streptomyces mexicanus TaxID=178566 RepID=UPI001F34D480|nr:pyridoxal-phosphate dependent enzyme [Streptomyces mexicanus]